MAVLAECTSGKTRPTPMTSESDSFQAFKAAGNACFAKKDYEGALEAYEQALVIEASDLPSLERAKVFTNKSLVLSHLGRTKEGLEAALAALAVDPTWDKGYVRKAAMLKAEGEAGAAALRLVLHEGLRACPTSKALMVALLEFEAEQGDVKSMTDLGVAYLKGLFGLSESNAQALPLLRQAAELGFGEAMYHLAGFVEDNDRQLDLYEKGAQAGHPGSMAECAKKLRKQGRYEEGLRWARQGAEAGDMEALLVMGNIYWTGGQGVDQNNDLAAEFYKKAMDAGHLTAPEYLGDYYQEKGDFEEAITLYGESYYRGNIDADRKLIQLLSHLGRHEEAEAWIHGPGPGVTRASSTVGPVSTNWMCQSYPQGRIERERIEDAMVKRVRGLVASGATEGGSP